MSRMTRSDLREKLLALLAEYLRQTSDIPGMFLTLSEVVGEASAHARKIVTEIKEEDKGEKPS